jgi:hypothetical protein
MDTPTIKVDIVSKTTYENRYVGKKLRNVFNQLVKRDNPPVKLKDKKRGPLMQKLLNLL